MGTNVVNTLCGGEPTYIDIAFENEGAGNVTETFYVDIYVDGVKVGYKIVDELQSGNFVYSEDWEVDPVIEAGQHTLKIVVDSKNDIAESDESDNEYAQTFTWEICNTPWIPPLYESILGEDSQEERLLRLRNFRDEVLLSNKTGQEYVDLLYDHSEEIASLLLDNPDLSSKTAEVVESLLPEVIRLQNGGEMTIAKDVESKIEALLVAFEDKASPGLKTTIRKVGREIKKGDIFRQLGIKATGSCR